MQASTGQRASAFVVTGLAGLLAGAALMSLIADEPATASDPGQEPLVAPELVRELHAIATGLAALRDSREHGSTANVTEARLPETLRANAGESAAIQSLADAVARLSERLAVPPGAGGTAAYEVPPPVPAQQERVAKVFDMDFTSLRAQHMLWTEQQVLDAYGLPTSVETRDRGLAWVWGTSPGPVFSLTIVDGRVISTNRISR